MAASSNESFGLKIATAFSIALTVVLLVAVYFLNSNYNLEVEKNTKAQAKISEQDKSIRDRTTAENEYRTQLGYAAIEDFDAAKAQMKKDQEQFKEEIKAIGADIATTVGDFQKKVEAKGIDGAQFEALKARAAEVVDAVLKNPDQSYKATLTRLKDLTANQAKITTILALNYIDIRRDLDLANQVNATQKKVVEDALAAAKAELDETIKKDEEARQGLVKSDREKSDQIATLDTKITNIINENNSKEEKRTKTIADQNSVIRDIRDTIARKEEVMNKPGGRVTYVDYGTGTVRVSVNKAQGVRPLMRFTIFDRNVAGITSARPKAAVELIKVGDPRQGENDSLARIVQTYDPNDPIRYNDYIFSAGWSYDHPQRYALIGKIDINRDGKDDRAELIRMIEAAGGVVEYDLPPPNTDRSPGQAAVARAFARLGEPIPPAVGRAVGKISGLAYAYVTDTRAPLIMNAKKPPEQTKEDTAFLQEESQATKEARDNSVRPLPLEKLLNMLGYDYSAPIEGRREGFDRAAVRQLLKPKGAAAKTDQSGTATPPPAEEPAAMPETPK